jgi:H/ACA ribonucleoprotein complex subunit 2
MAKDKSEKKGKKAKDTNVSVVAGETEDVDMAVVEEAKVRSRHSSLLSTKNPANLQKPKKEKIEEIIIPLEDLSPLAQPLAQKKLLKKLHKTIKKGMFTPSLFASGHS